MIDTLWNWSIWIWCALELLLALITRTRRGAGKVQDRGSMLLLWITIFASITAARFARALVPAARIPHADWLKPLGLAVFLSGFLLRLAAILNLGRAFSVNVAIRAEQTVQTTGLYRIVRHPSYLGLLIIFLGIGLETRSWLSLIILLVPFTAALLYRIRVEESALLAHFGEDYATYAAKTSRLLPGIY